MRVHRLFSSVSSLAAVSRNPEAVKVGPLHFRRTCHQQPTLGKCLQVLDLSSSPDLVCHNLMCEKVGDPCICRLSLALDKAANTLEELSLAGNRLTALPASIESLHRLRRLDLQRNHLTVAAVQDLRLPASLEIIDIRGNIKLQGFKGFCAPRGLTVVQDQEG